MKRERMTSLLRNTKGSTIIEFAVVAPVFFLLMMGIIEFGLYMVTEVTIESAVAQAGRVASVGSGEPDLKTTVENTIKKKVSGLPRSQEIVVTAALVTKNGATSVPDLCLINGANGAPTSDATCPPGVAFIDNNGNGTYEGNGGVTLGAPGQLVEVRATYLWHVFFPLFNQFFVTKDGNGNKVRGMVTITSSTIIKNEPNI